MPRFPQPQTLNLKIPSSRAPQTLDDAQTVNLETFPLQGPPNLVGLQAQYRNPLFSGLVEA